MGPITPYRWTLSVLLSICLHAAVAQPSLQAPELQSLAPDHASVIRDIQVTGHRRTREFIVLREVTLERGRSYTVAEILSNIRTTRQNLMNTTLFVDVNVSPCRWEGDSLDILVDVKERWYFWPSLYFRPVDRNWNVWVNQYDISLDRINYGLKFRGDNVTGRNDKLTLWLVNGYTRQLALKYFNPFADPSLRHGYGFEVTYAQNREVNYSTRRNQQSFYKDPNRFIREQFYAGVIYSYRKGSINRHTAKLGFWVDNVADTLLRLNPRFFNSESTRMTYPELSYSFQHLNVDYIPYPTRGQSLEFMFLKRGMGGPLDLWSFDVSASKYWTLPHKVYYSLQTKLGLKLPFDQPFINQPFLGYSDTYMRGLEYYVVDGVAGGYARNTVRKEIGRVNLRTGLKSRTYASIPFRFFLKAYGDVGLVYNRYNLTDNMLTNRFLYTGGFGIDVLTIYDWVIRLEYSFNQLNERAFFFHKGNL
jgi:outer membrane protein assembly factor BamA